jgi:hypothetical protein
MTNAELMTNPEGCGVICLERRGAGCAKVERGVLNALERVAVLPPGIRALSGQTAIVFRHGNLRSEKAINPGPGGLMGGLEPRPRHSSVIVLVFVI